MGLKGTLGRDTWATCKKDLLGTPGPKGDTLTRHLGDTQKWGVRARDLLVMGLREYIMGPAQAPPVWEKLFTEFVF